MKKLTYLLTTASGALAGYLFSNKKLRTDLRNSKNAEDAAKTLGKYLKADGKKIKKETEDFIHSKEVQDTIKKVKETAQSKVDQAKKEVQKLADKGKKKATTTAKKTSAATKKKASTTAKKIKKQIA